jgi:hypothetical protein
MQKSLTRCFLLGSPYGDKLSEFRKSSKMGCDDDGARFSCPAVLWRDKKRRELLDINVAGSEAGDSHGRKSPNLTPHSPPRIRNGYTGDTESIQHFAFLVKCFFGIIPFFFGGDKTPTGVGFL